MARKRYAIPQYGTVIMAGKEYYRTRIEDADGKRVALYGRTREELYDKVLEAREQIEDNTFRRSSPTVKEYCEKWLLLQSAQVRATTLTDYTSKVNRHIIKPLGHMNIADVTADDIRLALVPVSKNQRLCTNRLIYFIRAFCGGKRKQSDSGQSYDLFVWKERRRSSKRKPL